MTTPNRTHRVNTNYVIQLTILFVIFVLCMLFWIFQLPYFIDGKVQEIVISTSIIFLLIVIDNIILKITYIDTFPDMILAITIYIIDFFTKTDHLDFSFCSLSIIGLCLLPGTSWIICRLVNRANRISPKIKFTLCCFLLVICIITMYYGFGFRTECK